MAKKLKSMTSEQDKQLANAVRNSAQQIWQAGLGAFAKAQEEGGKVFSKLVKDGTNLQKRTKKIAEEKVGNVTDTVSKVADDVSKQASGSWDKLEQVFEERVARALSSMGVPTQKDIQLLTKRVEQLSKAVAELSEKKSSASTAEAKPRKPVAKKAVDIASGSATSAVKNAATAAKPSAAKKPVAAKPASISKTSTKTPTAKKPAVRPVRSTSSKIAKAEVATTPEASAASVTPENQD